MGILEEGNCSMNNGDYETAIEHYNNCVEVADENSIKTIAYFGLGNAYTLSDKGEEAINCFNDCLNLSSELEIKYFQHQIYFGLGSIHCTTKRLENGIKKDEMVCLCHVALGGLNKLLENYEKSLEHYKNGFSFIDCEHQEEEMQPRQRKENQQGNQQEQNKRRERPRRPRKVGGINVGKDFLNNLKNMSIVTSAGIFSGVLAVLWELAELFDKLEQYREAADIYELYLEIVTEDEDIEKQEYAMKYLIQLYEEEGRDFLKDSMTTRLQEFREKKKNQASYEKISLPSPMSDNDYDDIDKTSSTAVLDDNNSKVITGVSPSTSIPDADDNLEEHFSMNTSYSEEEGKQRLEVQELLRQPWKCSDKSIMHQGKFKKMEEYGRKHPEKVTLLNELRVIFKEEFLLGKGSDGTRVYLGLGKDGYGKAVKRLLRDNSVELAKREKDILNELNAKRSNYVVNFWDLKENLDEDYLYMILDLCEESLESYVESSSLQDLQKVVPKVLIQILNGLVHLHSGARPILHRDLRPSNVLRDVDGNFLIADFGISHLLSDETSTHQSVQRGAKNWIAPESYNASDASIDKVCYKKESDIMNAGMVAYYVATKGKHPFGFEKYRLQNMLDGKPVGLEEIKDVQLKDLLSWMLQRQPGDRPSADKALKHPYLQSDEEKFNMLCDMGNQLKVKHSQGQNSPTSDDHTPLLVHKVIRSTDWKTRPDLKKHFTNTKLVEQLEEINGKKSEDINDDMDLDVEIERVNGRKNKENPSHDELQLKEWKYFDQSVKHKEMFLKLIKYGRDPGMKVECVNDVRVIFSDEFCIGKGSDGTRVYLGLGKDGYGKAVKRIIRDNDIKLKHEAKCFNEINAKKSNYVVNVLLEENTGTEHFYLILDLCEESLESFVKSSTLQDLQKSLPEILKQMLKGLADLHCDPCPILHRNLKPSNVFRDAQGKFLIADFGISQISKDGSMTYTSNTNRETEYWIAPESYRENDESVDKARYMKESDVMNAGMVAYYVATKGEHAFGTEKNRLKNLLDGNPVGLEKIGDCQLRDLLSWMLEHSPKLRPSAKKALKHPYLQSAEENFDMLCDVVNQLEIEIRNPLYSDVHKQLNDPKNWMDRIDVEIFNNFNDFDPTWLGCLKFLQNVRKHCQDEPHPQLSPSEGNYKKYFLQVLPELPLLVHRIIRYIKRKSTPGLEKQFAKSELKEWKYFDQSVKHKEMFLKLIKYGRDPDTKVTCVNDVCVIFSDEFCIGKGNNETRVYLGLKNDGYGKAVKRIRRDNCTKAAKNETEILNEIKAKKSSYVVNYYHLEEDTGTEYVYLILDLCEESLESFVKSSTLEDLQKSLPKILKQILKGLADLHSESNPILHRDLKPSNVLRDAQGQYLIADFGISRILKNGLKTHVSNATKGTQHWIAPESYVVDEESFDKARYKPESDVMNAGMVAYYVATKGKHPFGPLKNRLKNLLDGNPVGLEEIGDFQLRDLLSWMLQHTPELRPSAKNALKHPYLLSLEKKFSMVCDMGNQPEMKQSQGRSSPNSDVVAQLYVPMKWMTRIDEEVLKDFITFKKNGIEITLTYKPTWARCLRFIRNVNEHWNDKPRTHLLRYVKEGNYVDYFLQRFPELLVLVHKIIRSTDWKTRADLQKHYTA